MTTLHTRGTLERELERVRSDILRMGSQVESAIERSVQALRNRDAELAQQIINDDEEINALRYAIEEHCLQLIATQQPAASDLRTVIAAMHIAVELERIADHAEGTAVLVKRLATGSFVEYPSTGNLWVRWTNNFNLLFLLVLNPGVAIWLIAGYSETIDPTHLPIDGPQLVTGLEITGLALYVAGCLLMAWALLGLRGNYQLGGSAPRDVDGLVIVGPYRFVRHPMYAAVLCICLGLACLI